MGSVDDVVLKNAADVGEEGGDDDGGRIVAEVLGAIVSSRGTPRILVAGGAGTIVCSVLAILFSLGVLIAVAGTDGRTGVEDDKDAKDETLGGGTLRGGAVGMVVDRVPVNLNLPSFSRGGTWKEIVSGRWRVATRSLLVVRTALSVTMGFACVICRGVRNGMRRFNVHSW